MFRSSVATMAAATNSGLPPVRYMRVGEKKYTFACIGLTHPLLFGKYYEPGSSKNLKKSAKEIVMKSSNNVQIDHERLRSERHFSLLGAVLGVRKDAKQVNQVASLQL